VTTVERRD